MRWVEQFDGVVDAPSPYAYGPSDEPPAGYRRFGAGSHWYQPVGAAATASDSAAIIAWLTSLNGGAPIDRYIGVGGTSEDFDTPIYYVQAGDPLTRVKVKAGGRDPAVAGKGRVTPLHWRKIPLPAISTPAPSTDGHFAVQTRDNLYEFWQGKNWTPGAGMVGCQWGGVLPLGGSGVPSPSGASAAGLSLVGGAIRLVDLQAGYIPHALFITTKYVRANVFQAPATGAALKDPGVTPGDANDLARPVTGSRLHLNMTAGEIDALGVPAWKKVVLKAMAEFGMFIGDTSGSGSWTIKVESSTMDTARGATDRWRTYAAAQGWSLVGGAGTPYIMPLGAGVNWASKLRVLAAS